MVGWHHQLNGHEFEYTLGVGDGQRRLGCCSPWDCKESDVTQRLNNNERDLHILKTEIVTFSTAVDFLLSHSSFLRKIGWTKNLIIIDSFFWSLMISSFFNQQPKQKSLSIKLWLRFFHLHNGHLRAGHRAEAHCPVTASPVGMFWCR